MRWLCNTQALYSSTLRSPRTMVSHPLNSCNASSMSRRCSIIDRGRYAPTSGVRVGQVTILQLTKFGPWKRVDSILQLSGRSPVTIPMPPWSPPALDGCSKKHVTSYTRRFWEYASVCIFVSVMSITSTPPISTARMACTNLKPRPSRIFSVPMASLV